MFPEVDCRGIASRSSNPFDRFDTCSCDFHPVQSAITDQLYVFSSEATFAKAKKSHCSAANAQLRIAQLQSYSAAVIARTAMSFRGFGWREMGQRVPNMTSIAAGKR
jgi:hypothetical protein